MTRARRVNGNIGLYLGVREMTLPSAVCCATSDAHVDEPPSGLSGTRTNAALAPAADAVAINPNAATDAQTPLRTMDRITSYLPPDCFSGPALLNGGRRGQSIPSRPRAER
jgi:hypothetical protein